MRDGSFYVPTVMTQLSSRQYLFALGAGLLVAIVGGIGWGQFRTSGDLRMYGYDWSFWWVLGITLVTGEAIGRASNERRNTNLQLIAAGSVLLAAMIAFAWQYSIIRDYNMSDLFSNLSNSRVRERLGLSIPNAFFLILGMIVSTRRLEG